MEDITPENAADAGMTEITPVSGLYKNWFLDYASYVILDRAVPYLDDGLKPVQRRILHALREMDDGRFNKVANVIGSTMQYHPHGDAAIGEAIVNLGQKDLLLDTQGNWGNVFTGDSAAAPRYIETRLSKFALEVVFNPDTTEWTMSYDGRKREPVMLPVKFPLVLAQGVEGIAVGLSTKILPHNFCELVEASIAVIRGRDFELYPDFPSGGMIDVRDYNHGERGGRVRVRATIREIDKHTLVITDIPYGTTTGSLIESIIKANDKGKIKIRKIDDNTARNVEIVVHLAKGISPSVAIDGLYAFTQCEVSLSPNCCVILDEKPVFTDVKTVLRQSTHKTVELLKRELEIRLGELEEAWHFSSLEKIFIENRIYRDIEECETWESVIETIDRGLEPWKPLLRMEVTEDDIVRLTEIKIKRISKFDSFKADEHLRGIEDEIELVNDRLLNLKDHAVSWFKRLLEKYGKGRGRLTEIRTFDTIQAQAVAVNNAKLFVNRAEGFVGIGLKKDENTEFVADCSDMDDIIIFRRDGIMKVVRAGEKIFVGKNIEYAGVLKKNDDRMVYHMIYRDGGDKRVYAKRFQVMGITRDKEYNLTKSDKAGMVYYFSANPNGESEVVTVKLKPGNSLRKPVFDFDFAELGIKGRSAGGNLVTKFDVSKVTHKSRGVSTLGGRDIWFDPAVNRLNTDKIGQYLGQFSGEDRILVLYDDGTYELTNYELTNRYDGKGKLLEIAKLTPETVISVVHYEGKNKNYYVKRFHVETSTLDTKFSYISDEPGSRMLLATCRPGPRVKLNFHGKKEAQEVELESFIDVKGWKATGNKISEHRVNSADLLSWREPEPEPAAEETAAGAVDIPFEIEDTRGKDDAVQGSLF